MTTPESEDSQSRPLASYETGFWAFLEYPSVRIAIVIFMAWMVGVLIVLTVRG